MKSHNKNTYLDEYEDDIDWLRQRVQQLTDDRNAERKLVDTLQSHIDHLESMRKQMLDVLKFYAEFDNYVGFPTQPVVLDAGARARSIVKATDH